LSQQADDPQPVSSGEYFDEIEHFLFIYSFTYIKLILCVSN